eukprot:jgi/Botrbrau1/11519/Bobra.0198s0016.1
MQSYSVGNVGRLCSAARTICDRSSHKHGALMLSTYSSRFRPIYDVVPLTSTWRSCHWTPLLGRTASRVPFHRRPGIRGFRTTVVTMGLKTGIVGLPNVGKSTLFNAICEGGKAQAANFPFCTIEPNVGIVTVPDHRLQVLSELGKSKAVVATTVEFVDIAGLVKGASKGEGLGNQFLANIRECDSIVQVIKMF